MIRKDLDKSISEEVEKNLLELHFSHPDVLESIKAGWIEAQSASHFKKVPNKYYLDFLK
jgi:hypothetical protein